MKPEETFSSVAESMGFRAHIARKRSPFDGDFRREPCQFDANSAQSDFQPTSGPP